MYKSDQKPTLVPEAALATTTAIVTSPKGSSPHRSLMESIEVVDTEEVKEEAINCQLCDQAFATREALSKHRLYSR